jgi:UDP-glucose 4-epimerase
MVVPTFVEQALAGDPLTVYGDGTQTRCFTHVEAAVRVTRELLETPGARGDVFNVGATQATTIKDLAKAVLDRVETPSEITHVPFDEVYGEDFEEPKHRQPDVSKLRETIGWAPDGELDTILESVIQERSGEEDHRG